MINRYKNIILGFVGIFIIIFGLGLNSFESHCENVVVVIDPGHGGEALGGNIDDRIERDINLITAKAMKERLEQYEGIDVYLTRDNNEDDDISRKERLEVARECDADFFFSIHYNMSENHTLFGSEVWIQSIGDGYAKGYSFATIEMEALTGLGLFDRGIKNKLDNDKTGEYYGILKYGEEYDIPSVIIEHCHLDEERDSQFWNEEGYTLLGHTDADCVAKYFNLSSNLLGIDNSGYEKITVEAPSKRKDRDYDEPQYCNISLDKLNEESADFTIQAKDNETYIQYYQISTDGGRHFGRLEVWEDRDSEYQSFNFALTTDEQNIVIAVYDQYENYCLSEKVNLPALVLPEAELETSEYEDGDIDLSKTDNNDKGNFEGIKYKYSAKMVLVVTIVALLILFNIIFAIVVLTGRKTNSDETAKGGKPISHRNTKVTKAAKTDFEPIDFDWDDDFVKKDSSRNDTSTINSGPKSAIIDEADDILEGFDWK